MTQNFKTRSASNLTRRTILKGAAGTAALAASGSMLAMPAIAQARSIKIGSYGGYFEDSFKKYVYPAFTEATGITVESVTQPNSSDWLVTMQQAAASGTVPADVSLYGKDTMIKATRIGDMLKPLDASKIPGVTNLDAEFLYEGPDGLVGVGSMAWFNAMVINPNEVTPAPTSWKEFWENPAFEGSLGISKKIDGRLLDITAKTFFDGAETLMSEDGIVAVLDKVAELKPHVALWWSAESQMEQAMKNEDVIAGSYYLDVANIMASDGFPIKPLFPAEGNPIGYGSWCLSPLSEKTGEAYEFMAFSSDPATQALMSRNIGTAPLVNRELTDLTDEEFAFVSGSPIITPAYESYLDNETFIKERWDAMLAGA
ncbi:PotD/PotF family extracellular solute-binding protein [Roseibium sp. MMSF_3412]|uniref:ABC transporter substrate-binding protein n=1 Tax=Roseibium sp. MMSF_3412 TaxID=3046712 RepID=UPI0027402648|nr:extracellular solute-binding protein [Roseibium sp. MMSF_3412]